MNFFAFIIQFKYFCILLLITESLFAKDAQEKLSQEATLFGTDEILEIKIKTDLRQLIRNKNSEEYQEGEITLLEKTYPVRLKVRGNYLRENCTFPPVTLNFSKTEFEDNSYDQLKNLILVNACKMQDEYEQYILREYLIYRAFNLMTEKSFRVRLLKIEYVDSKQKLETVTRYGFVVEDQYKMADRIGGIIIKKEGIEDQSTNKTQMVMLSVFQFLMGNTDWQVSRLHNLTLIKPTDVSEPAPYVIPYDFDYTGMVNASYAIPSPILGIEKINERLYLGKCYPETELKEAIAQFLEKKDAIYSLYENFELFDKESLSYSISYLDSFYEIIQDEKKWKSYFMDNCRE